MAVRKIRDRWWVDIRYNFVRYRKKSPLNTKGGAQAYETYLRGELAKHGSLEHLGPKPPEAKPVTFAEFAERWMREYVAVNNKWSEQRSKEAILRVHLVPEFGRLPLAAIDAARIDRFKAELLRGTPVHGRVGLHPKTVNNVLAVLRKCLVSATDWGELDRLPVIRRLKLGPVPYRYLSDAEVESLLAAATPGPWRTMVLLAVKTGLRYSELAGLRWEDIDFERRQLVVQRGKVLGRIGSPKSGRTRCVPLAVDVLTALWALDLRDGPVFSHVETHKQAWYALARFSEAAGLERVGWHDLRHTFATMLASAGASLRTVQELLGHASIVMTMRYAHVGPQELRAAINLLEPGEKGNGWSRSSSTPSPSMPPGLAISAQQSQTTAFGAVV